MMCLSVVLCRTRASKDAYILIKVQTSYFIMTGTITSWRNKFGSHIFRSSGGHEHPQSIAHAFPAQAHA